MENVENEFQSNERLEAATRALREDSEKAEPPGDVVKKAVSIADQLGAGAQASLGPWFWLGVAAIAATLVGFCFNVYVGQRRPSGGEVALAIPGTQPFAGHRMAADNSDPATQKKLDEMQKELDQYKNDKEQALEEIGRLKKEYEQKFIDSQMTLDADRADFNKELRLHQMTEADLSKRIDELIKRNDALRDKLSTRRVSPQEAIVREADGAIVSVAQDNVVYINLGSDDHVAPGMAFEVYDKEKGVPGLGKDPLTDQDLPVGIASIEVVHVDESASQCRVTQLQMGRYITKGDPIANLVYDRNTTLNFVIYGKFDLKHIGRPADADREKIQGLVVASGGKIQNQINVDTDFVIMGAEPQVKQFTQDELQDPFNAQQKRDQEQELKNYNDVLNQARELHIPVMNQNRFLYFCGYYANNDGTQTRPSN